MDTVKTLFLLGGYGGAGRRIADFLLGFTNVKVILAGRHGWAAQQLASELNNRYHTDRVTGAEVDATDHQALSAAIGQAQVVVSCATTVKDAAHIARCALEANIDYLDIYFPAAAYEQLKPLEQQIIRQGRCFITQAGFHPGLLAPLIRYAARGFDRYHTANLGICMRAPELGSLASASEIVDSIGSYTGEIYTGKAWRRSAYRDMRRFDFGAEWGRQACWPLTGPELKSLPAELGLEALGVYIAGFNKVIDYALTPLIIFAYQLKPFLGRLGWTRAMLWANKKWTRPPFGVVMLLEAAGLRKGQSNKIQLRLSSEDAYVLTAVAVVACIRQYLSADPVASGLWMMGNWVNAPLLIRDLQLMGVKWEENL